MLYGVAENILFIVKHFKNYLAMGIFESQEFVFDLICDKFSDVSGIRTGIEEDTVVYAKNGTNLWMKICDELKIRANFVPHLMTIEDYVHEWSSIIAKHNTARTLFVERLQKFVEEKTGHIYAPDELLCSELLPKPIDEATVTKLGRQQYLREEMAYALAVDNLKNAVRNRYNYFKYKASFSEAKTITKLADVLFGKEYPVL